MWDKEDQIDKKTLEISQADDEVYKSMLDLGDELPDHSPRFILLSYPLTLVCSLILASVSRNPKVNLK